MTIDTSRIEAALLSRFRSIANRYRSWRITKDQMERETEKAVADAMHEISELLKESTR